MELTVNSLWTFLQSLNLTTSNKEWLAERLIADVTKENRDEAFTKEVYELCGSLQDERTPEKMAEDIKSCRQFYGSRKIMPQYLQARKY